MKLVIIAGGKGSRLGLKEVPKPMVKIGDKPVIEYQIDLAKRYGLTDIYILSGHLSDVIENYFDNGTRFGVNITYIAEKKPLGTAGSVKQLESIINDRFMVFYGDTVMDINLLKLIEFDQQHSSALATLLVHPNNHPFDSDLIEMDESGRITAFHSKPHIDGKNYQNMVNAALYILSPEIFRYIPHDISSDFGKNTFPLLLQEENEVYAYLSHEYIKDMGTKDRLIETGNDLLGGKVARLNATNKRKAIFIDRDGVINREVDNLTKIDDFELLEGVSRAIKRINKSEYLVVIITNQPVIAKGFIKEYELIEIHKKLDTLLGRDGAYINKLYYCPHHPDNGFEGEVPELKINCSCRKPNTGMVDMAKDEMNIDLSESFMIGDTTTDIQTGLNAGLTTILVQTGYAGQDFKFDVKPHFEFANLEESVDFILNAEEQNKNDKIIFQEIYSRIKGWKLIQFNEKFIISIGGLSRSGKSTFANKLHLFLNSYNINSSIICLDNWLVSKKERDSSMTVYERYKTEKITDEIIRLCNNEEIEIGIYNPRTRSIHKNKTLNISESEVVIIDGVLSLGIPSLLSKSNYRIFVDINEDIRKDRFYSFYNFKGLNMDEIELLYRDRQIDESPFVLASKANADLIIENHDYK